MLVRYISSTGNNGTSYEESCCGIRGTFAEDAIRAEVFVRTWDAATRRCTGPDFSHLFCDQALATEFLKDVGLIRSNVL